MVKFNTLLSEAGIAPERVQLVRHQDTRLTARTTPHALWRSTPEKFEHYQCLQGRSVFDEEGYLASFVVPPNGETLFAGLYEIHGRTLNSVVEVCPVSSRTFEPSSINVYEISKTSSPLADLAGLLTVDWGPGMRSWVQRAHKQDKTVTELRKAREEPPFPSFPNFHVGTDELETLPTTWRAVLGATGGVYLLVSLINGEQYVGSATGDEGFWARWMSYARDGHGGNILLRQRGKPPYQITVLETASSSDTRSEVIAAEQRWKQKLGTRAFGLNAN